MKVKNVLAEIRKQYDVEEINILTESRAMFSGTVKQWDTTDMLLLKKAVGDKEVENWYMFNGRKAFLFIKDDERL